MASCGISTLIGARARAPALAPWLATATLLCGPAGAQPAPEVFVTATPDPPVRPAESRLPAAAAPQPASAMALAGRPTPTVTSVVDLKAPAPGGPPTAQIASLGSVAEASQALSRLGDLLVAPLKPEIQPAVSGEKIYYRALVAGFATRADAAAFCVSWKRRGGACFVR